MRARDGAKAKGQRQRGAAGNGAFEKHRFGAKGVEDHGAERRREGLRDGETARKQADQIDEPPLIEPALAIGDESAEQQALARALNQTRSQRRPEIGGGVAQAEKADDHQRDGEPGGVEDADAGGDRARQKGEDDHRKGVKRQQKPGGVQIEPFACENDGEQRGVGIHEGDEESGGAHPQIFAPRPGVDEARVIRRRIRVEGPPRAAAREKHQTLRSSARQWRDVSAALAVTSSMTIGRRP